MKSDSNKISVKGKWIRVPVLDVGGNKLIVRGKWLKMAIVWGGDWLESEISDPDLCVNIARHSSLLTCR